MENLIHIKRILKNLFKNETNLTSIQFFRYICVGGISFIVDIGLLYILTEFLGVNYLISAAIAFIFALIINYFLCIKWIFTTCKIRSIKYEFGIFTAIGTIGLILNELFIWFFTGILGFNYLISKILAAVAILIWNFIARKIILYK